MKKSKDRLIIATRNSTNNIKINRTIIRKQKQEEKQQYGYFKQLTDEISHEKTWTWLRKGIFEREMESLLIAAQNNAIRINYVKVKIDETQQNSKCRLCRLVRLRLVLWLRNHCRLLMPNPFLNINSSISNNSV